jgi:hypothetical protein
LNKIKFTLVTWQLSDTRDGNHKRASLRPKSLDKYNMKTRYVDKLIPLKWKKSAKANEMILNAASLLILFIIFWVKSVATLLIFYVILDNEIWLHLYSWKTGCGNDLKICTQVVYWSRPTTNGAQISGENIPVPSCQKNLSRVRFSKLNDGHKYFLSFQQKYLM